MLMILDESFWGWPADSQKIERSTEATISPEKSHAIVTQSNAIRAFRAATHACVG